MSAKTEKDIRRTKYVKQLDDDLTRLTKAVSDLADDHRKVKCAAFDTLKLLEDRIGCERELRKAIIEQERIPVAKINAFLRLPWYKRLFRRFE